jgi:hypothetical protein
MKPTFHFMSSPPRSPRRRGAWLAVGLAVVASSAASARAQVVTGRVEGVPSDAPEIARRGYVRTRVTAASSELGARPRSVAVFLRAKESFTLEPSPPAELTLSGLGLEPSVAACPVDGEVVLVNGDVEPATFRVDGQRLGPVAPGDSATYACTVGEQDGELRSLVVEEWPSVRGTVYYGELGAAGTVDEDGRFAVKVAQGTYTLQVIGQGRILAERPVEVEDRNLNIGTIELEEDANEP